MLRNFFKPLLKSFIVLLKTKQYYFSLNKKYLISLFLLGIFLLWPILTFAQVDFGLSYGTAIGLGTQDIRITVAKIIKISLGVLGILVTLIIMYGGYVWMTSGGNMQKVDTAKKILLNGVIGLFIIILAYAITTWLFKMFLTASNGNNGSGSCTEGQEQGCNVCIAGHWVFDSGLSGCSLSGAEFRVTDTATSHSGNDDAQQVNRCSRILSKYSNKVDSISEDKAEDAGELLIASHPGEFITSGNSITFKHKDLFDAFTTYELKLPKNGNSTPLMDKGGLQLTVCDPIVGCTSDATHFNWRFETNDEVDEVNPYITKTYPISDKDNSKYPDQNVSLAPIIKVEFSEEIDPTTVADVDGHPLASNILLQKLNGEGGQVVADIDSTNLEVNFTNKGFEIYLIAPNILDSFTWYRMTVQNIEDLCGNPMEEPKIWEFETNDNAPGVKSFSPQGDRVCPDTTILISFGTSMYNQSVSFVITGSDNSIYDASIKPSLLTPGHYQVSGTGGYLRVIDTDDPKSNNFKTFEFVPYDSLNINTTYNVSVTTDLVMNTAGDLLRKDWSFSVTSPDSCACSPYVTKISPNEGKAGQCLTVQGRCFQGTENNPAVPTVSINGINSEIKNADDTYLTTTAPQNLARGTIAPVIVTIAYQDNALGNLSSNDDKTYYINEEGIYDGPCLWKMNPISGCFGQGINMQGQRFGNDPGEGNRSSLENNVTFNSQKKAIDSDFSLWRDDLIRTKVPKFAIDGDVYVTAGGQISNALPFDISCGVGASCSSVENLCSQDNTVCQTNLYCDETCHCQKYDNGGGGEGDSCDGDTETSQCEVNDDLCKDDYFCDEDSCTCQKRGKIGAPRVKNKWPNCNRACPNSEIGAEFSKEIDEDTLNNSILLWQCSDKDCLTSTTTIPTRLDYNETDKEVYIRQINPLLNNTKYRVIIKNSVTGVTGVPLSGLNFDFSKDQQNDSYSWVFTTKDKECSLTSIDTRPTKISFNKAKKDKSITGRAISSEQECDGSKTIDATKYNWVWNSDDVTVATVSHNDTEEDDDNLIDPQQEVTSVFEGETKIHATVNDKGNNFTDYSEVKVELHGYPCDADITSPSCQPNDSVCSVGDICDIKTCTCQPDPSPPSVKTYQPQGTNACLNSLIYVTFDQKMNPLTLNEDTIRLIYDGVNESSIPGHIDENDIFCKNGLCSQPGTISPLNVKKDSYYCDNDNGCTVARFFPNNLLYANTNYRIWVGRNGTSTVPVSLHDKEMVSDWESDIFVTGDTICRLEKIDVDPNYRLFTLAGQTQDFVARSLDKDDRELAPMPGFYDWQITWQENDDNAGKGIITLDPGVKDSNGDYYNTDKQTAMAENLSGNANLVAISQITTAVTSTKDKVGRRLRDDAEIENFICMYPWPIPPDVYSYQPFMDNDYGFQTRYCRSKDGSDKEAGLIDGDKARLSTFTSDDKTLRREYLFYYYIDLSE